MQKVFLREAATFLVATLIATPSFAATCAGGGTCFFVTETGAGLKDGSSWGNAFEGIPSNGTHRYFVGLKSANLQRGATYYIADGSYPGYSFTNAGGGTQLITIKKATIADHGILNGAPDPSWNDGMGDGEAVFTASGAAVWLFAPGTKFYHFDGQRGLGKSPGGYGFRLFNTASRNTTARMIDIDSTGAWADVGDVTDITLEHIEFDWNNGTAAGPCAAATSIQVSGTKPSGRWTIARNYFHHGSGGAIFIRSGGIGTFTIDNNYLELMGDETNGGACPGAADHAHWETFWFTNVPDLLFTNNTLVDAYPAGLTGWVMFGAVTNARVFNNLFYCTNASTCSPGGNGIVAAWSADTNNNIQIYHNTFVDLFNGGAYLFEKGSGFVARNNLYFNPQFRCAMPTQSNEACGGGQGCCGTSQQTGISAGIFKNYAADNFELAHNTDPGLPLGTEFVKDKNGVTRTTWSRGAYEYVGGGGSAPSSPTDVKIAN